MSSMTKPEWAFRLWAFGMGDLYCVNEPGLEIRLARRLFWRIRGEIMIRLFGWWRWA
jgi:hypothetical protein